MTAGWELQWISHNTYIMLKLLTIGCCDSATKLWTQGNEAVGKAFQHLFVSLLGGRCYCASALFVYSLTKGLCSQFFLLLPPNHFILSEPLIISFSHLLSFLLPCYPFMPGTPLLLGYKATSLHSNPSLNHSASANHLNVNPPKIVLSF